MNEEAFQRKLADLIAEIATINGRGDRARLQEIAEQTRARHAELKTTVAQRVSTSSVKYLLFDLEATRRENVHLKQKPA